MNECIKHKVIDGRRDQNKHKCMLEGVDQKVYHPPVIVYDTCLIKRQSGVNK